VYKKFSQVFETQIPTLVQILTRNITDVVWHCTATIEGQSIPLATIEKWHRDRGFNEIGYNLIIDLDGKAYMGRDWNKVPAHVAGNNARTLGFVYVGGLDKNRRPKDTRTPEQIETMLNFSEVMRDSFQLFYKQDILLGMKGHRDYSPDRNGNGIIEEWEWIKACPCFDVKTEICNKIKK